jgi:hypothetical protein
VLALLVGFTLPVQVRCRVRQGRRRIWSWQSASRALRLREVAHLVGCSESFVRKTCAAITNGCGA